MSVSLASGRQKRCKTAIPAGALLWLLLSVVMSVVMPVQAADILDVRLWRAPDHTRVVLDLSHTISYSLLVLDNPQRLVIDVADARLINALTNLPLENTPISRVRSGVRYGDNLRIVFDLKAKIRPKSFPLEPNERTGHRLVLDLFDEDIKDSEVPAVKSVDQLSNRRDIIVAIDAGHGGEDPGALGPKKL